MNASERHDKVVLYSIAGVIALLPLLAAFAHRGYSGALLLVGTIAVTRSPIWRAGAAQTLRRPVRGDLAAFAAWSFAAFSAWLLISGLWSDVQRPWKVWSDFTFTVLAAVALVFEILRRSADEPALRLIAGCYLASAALAVVLFAVEAATGGALRAAVPPNNPEGGQVRDMIALARGLTAVIPSLFAAAAVAVLWRRKLDSALRFCLGVGFSLAAFAAALFSVTANSAALLAGALAYLATLFAPRLVLRGFGVAIAIAALGAPIAAFLPAARLAAGGHFETSWAQRLFIYEEGGKAALACAPLGCGADYGRVLSRENELVSIQGAAAPLPVMPLHPHNIFLQIWMDLGAPGAVTFGAAALFGFLALARLDAPRLFFAATAATVSCLLVSALIEASLWQNWRVAAGGFAAGGLALSYAFHRLHLKPIAEPSSGAG